MAESDGKPASSPLSTEEADRLSEKFKPSWETEPDPPTIPKVEPPKTFAKQTLLGIAAPAPQPRPAEAPSKAPDDLDWELPTNPVPESAVETQPIIEPPPKSNPSGVGQTYVPKDVDAPAIVLKEEVKRAEEVALAQLDAEHKARSAPTVLKFKAIESPQKAAADEIDEDAFVTPKRGLGVYLGLGAGAILVALIGIMVVVKGTGGKEPLPPPPEAKVAEPPAKAEPAPPPPPPITTTEPTPAPPPEPKAAEPVVAPVSDPKALEPPKVEPKPAPEPEPPPPKPVAAAKPEPAPKPTPAPKPPKPVSTAPKPAAAPKSQKPASGGIVRDAPF